jgi:hypothetical protein
MLDALDSKHKRIAGKSRYAFVVEDVVRERGPLRATARRRPRRRPSALDLVALAPTDKKSPNRILVKRRHHDMECREPSIRVPGDAASHDDEAARRAFPKRLDCVDCSLPAGLVASLIEPIDEENSPLFSRCCIHDMGRRLSRFERGRHCRRRVWLAKVSGTLTITRRLAVRGQASGCPRSTRQPALVARPWQRSPSRKRAALPLERMRSTGRCTLYPPRPRLFKEARAAYRSLHALRLRWRRRRPAFPCRFP